MKNKLRLTTQLAIGATLYSGATAAVHEITLSDLPSTLQDGYNPHLDGEVSWDVDNDGTNDFLFNGIGSAGVYSLGWFSANAFQGDPNGNGVMQFANRIGKNYESRRLPDSYNVNTLASIRSNTAGGAGFALFTEQPGAAVFWFDVDQSDKKKGWLRIEMILAGGPGDGTLKFIPESDSDIIGEWGLADDVIKAKATPNPIPEPETGAALLACLAVGYAGVRYYKRRKDQD